MVNMEHDTPVVEYKNPGEIRESSEITRLEKYKNYNDNVNK